MPLFELDYVGIFTLVLAFIFGTVLASFITCTAGRLLAGMDWINEHSHCDTCGHQLGALDLFPIFSYVLLGGKCRYCGAKVPVRCLISEVLLGVVFVLVVLSHGYIDMIMVRNLLLAMLMMGISFCEIDGKVIHGGFITTMLVFWIGTLPFVPDLKYYIADGAVACFVICGPMLIASYIRSQKKQGTIKPEFIRLAAVYMLYLGLMKGAAAFILTFVVRKILKTENKHIVPELSVCTLICLCAGEILLGDTALSYIPALADAIRVF